MNFEGQLCGRDDASDQNLRSHHNELSIQYFHFPNKLESKEAYLNSIFNRHTVVTISDADERVWLSSMVRAS